MKEIKQFVKDALVCLLITAALFTMCLAQCWHDFEPVASSADTVEPMATAEPEPKQTPITVHTEHAPAVELAAVIEAKTEPKPEPTPEIVAEPWVEPVEEETPWYTERELEILAIIIYQEAGADYISDDTRIKVGEVFLNRVADPRFPDTFLDVATAKSQYGTLYWTGIQWPARAANEIEAHAVQRAYDIAERVLNGERTMPEDTVWQAEFAQGKEIVAHQDNTYFCR